MTTNGTAEDLAARVLARESRAIARAMRWVDERDLNWRPLLKALHSHTGGASVLGVTGAAGSGKSSLVDRIVQAERKAGRTVGVVAVDPSSPFTGGAALGDRIRMQQHFLDDGVFIRSLATRGHVGGLSRSAADVVRILDAAGFERVIVETVGIGQDEFDVTRLAHTVLVVLAPGLGDDVQAIKAGILEIADVFVVNKADRDGADATLRDIEQMIALGSPPRLVSPVSHSAAVLAPDAAGPIATGRWVPPVVRTVATRNEGIDALMVAAESHRKFLFETPAGVERRSRRIEQELREIVRDTLIGATQERVEAALTGSTEALLERRDDPYSIAERIVAALVVPPGAS